MTAAAELLSSEDEAQLSRTIHDGLTAGEMLDDAAVLDEVDRAWLEAVADDGREARNRFVEAHLRLVPYFAQRVFGRPLHDDDPDDADILQAGALGLIRAAELYDPASGNRFSTYAQHWIRQAIARDTGDGVVHLPTELRWRRRSMRRVEDDLHADLGRAPTSAELADATGMPERRVEDLRYYDAALRSPMALDGPVRLGDDDEGRLGDQVRDDDATDPADVATLRAATVTPAEIERLLAPLDERERQILALRFGMDRGEPRTLEEVAAYFGLTRERIRQIEARAMSKLRHPSADTGA